jgi:predicted enzyme related to lactoylglutathione lyase
MERVIGIGGLFFRAQNPRALNAWYAEHLGASGGPDTEEVWQQEAGPTVWSAFDADTDYFGRREQAWMVNFRVRDLDAMLTQLETAGAEIDDNVEEYDYGRFGWATDPEGNRFELWEPKSPVAGSS